MCIFNDTPDTPAPPPPAPPPAQAPKLEKAVPQKSKTKKKQRLNRSGTRSELALNSGSVGAGLNTGG